MTYSSQGCCSKLLDMLVIWLPGCALAIPLLFFEVTIFIYHCPGHIMMWTLGHYSGGGGGIL